MTSVLNVDTIADKAGTGPVALTKQHAAKAWASSNQASIIDSFNVASTTDNQQADTTYTYTNTMSNAGYAAGSGSVGPSSGAQAGPTSYHTPTTGSIRVVTFDEMKNSNGRFDTSYQAVTVSGDLA